MLDSIRCKYPLPDGYDPGPHVFYTEDLDNMGLEFTLTPQGRLVSDRWHYESDESENDDDDISVDEISMGKVIGSRKVVDEKDVDWDHHGEVEFYQEDDDGNRRVYTAYFDEGQLTRISRGTVGNGSSLTIDEDD